MSNFETAFEMTTSNIRFGPGVTREVGAELAELRPRKVLVLTDRVLARLHPVTTTLESLDDHRIAFDLYTSVRVEPTDESFHDAIRVAKDGEYDAFIAVGGGSTIDTAKAANLYSTYRPATSSTMSTRRSGKACPCRVR